MKRENTENTNVPVKTIHFLTILSAKNPKNSIVIPVIIVNVNVNVPNGAVFPPNPKKFEIINKFGEIMLEIEDTKETTIIKSIIERVDLFFL